MSSTGASDGTPPDASAYGEEGEQQSPLQQPPPSSERQPASSSLSFGPWTQPHNQLGITDQVARTHKQHAQNFANLLLVMVTFGNACGCEREVNACMGTCVTLWGNWQCRLRLWRKLIDMPFGVRGDTRLMLAARHVERGHLYMPRILAAGEDLAMGDRGADVEKRNLQGQTALIVACIARNTKAVNMLLDIKDIKGIKSRAVDIEAKDGGDHGASALIWMCILGYDDMVRLLLDKGANIEARDAQGSTALFLACKHEQTSTCHLLIKRGADVNALRLADDTSPLYWACYWSRANAVKMLLASGADARIGLSPLIGACHGGAAADDDESRAQNRLHIVQKLLLCGTAKVNKRDNQHFSALMWACYRGHNEVVKLLLGRGATVNATSRSDLYSPLSVASEQGHASTVVRLLESKADINALTGPGCGNTALWLACYYARVDVVRALLVRGADANIGNSPCILAACQDIAEEDRKFVQMKGFASRRFQIAREILRYDTSKINAVKDSWTSLMFATSRGDVPLVELLIEKGATVNTQNLKGEDAISLAIHAGYTPIVKLLLARKASFLAPRYYRVRNNVSCNFTVACEKGHLQIVQLLIEHGADVNEVDYLKKSASTHQGEQVERNYGEQQFKRVPGAALVVACRHGHLEVVRLLLANGIAKSSLIYGQPVVEASKSVPSAHEDVADFSHRRLQIVQELCNHCDITESDARTLVNSVDGHIASLHNRPISYACARNDVPLAAFLLSKGASPHSHTDQSALMIASKNGCRDAVALLLENGVKQDLKWKGKTPLMHASCENRAETVALLLDSANAKQSMMTRSPWNNRLISMADVLCDYRRMTALCYASYYGNVESVRVLCSRGADVNAGECPPIVCACQALKEDDVGKVNTETLWPRRLLVVKELLRCGAQVLIHKMNPVVTSDSSPLELAKRNAPRDMPELVALLRATIEWQNASASKKAQVVSGCYFYD